MSVLGHNSFYAPKGFRLIKRAAGKFNSTRESSLYTNFKYAVLRLVFVFRFIDLLLLNSLNMVPSSCKKH